MIGPLTFAIAHLAIVLVVVGWAVLSLRQARTEPFRNRRRGAKYRRLTDEEIARRLDNATKPRRP